MKSMFGNWLILFVVIMNLTSCNGQVHLQHPNNTLSDGIIFTDTPEGEELLKQFKGVHTFDCFKENNGRHKQNITFNVQQDQLIISTATRADVVKIQLGEIVTYFTLNGERVFTILAIVERKHDSLLTVHLYGQYIEGIFEVFAAKVLLKSTDCIIYSKDKMVI